MNITMVCGGNEGGGTLEGVRNMCKKAQSNSSYTQYPLSAYSSRVKDVTSDTGIAVDTTNKVCYLYAEFTANGNQGSASSYYGLLKSTAASTYLNPLMSSSGEIARQTHLMTDPSSTQNKIFGVIVFGADSTLGIATMYGQTITSGDKYIVYGTWQYT